MQQTQQNYNLLTLAAVMLFMAAAPVVAHPSKPDPLLSGSKPGPCDPKLDQPDYVGGVDVAGNPVAPADVPSARNPVPSEIVVPLNRKQHGGENAVAVLDGRTLEPLLNPAPNCVAKPR